ncbi:MAG: hypothetical protein KDK38_05340, partial [Leptospiraceae bacterium]|nr:hypothetical protein [Leptospiraceae bacterium]
MNPQVISEITVEKIVNLQSLLQIINTDIEFKSRSKKLLIGAYYTMEYSIESAAFFNPSIVEHPDQSGLEQEKEKRIILSFRATGEGHISSLVFREGYIDQGNKIILESVSKLLDVPEVVNRHIYIKVDFFKKLHEMNIYQFNGNKQTENNINLIKQTIQMIMNKLEDKFTYDRLHFLIEEAMKDPELTDSEKTAVKTISWLADSHYEIEFSLDTAVSERVIFPISYTERNGIEDARFEKFTDEDGSIIYFAS